MPYRLDEGEMDRMKICSKAAVFAATTESRRSRGVWRWAATAVAVCLAAVVIVGYWGIFSPSHYDRLVEQLADAPMDVLYEMSSDIIEYQDNADFL